MKILFIKQLFNPEPTAKSLDFALELVTRGHEVQVLTGFPSYPIGDIYPGYKQSLCKIELMEGIKIFRIIRKVSDSEAGQSKGFDWDLTFVRGRAKKSRHPH